MADLKKASASTSLEIWVDCPYCDNYQEATEQLRECLGDDLRAEGIEEELTCDNKECGKVFLVDEITY